jgi:ribonuclease P protein component
MPTVGAKFGLPKSVRLKSSLLIQKTVKQRQSLFSYPIKCFYALTPSAETAFPKVAFLVSKKRFRHAVDRNRVKRLLRESYRLHIRELVVPERHDLSICIMFVAAKLPDFSQVEEAMDHLLKDLQSQLHTNEPAPQSV